MKVGCTIPCFKGSNVTIDIIRRLTNFVDLIVFVDDCCPFNIGEKVNKEFKGDEVIVLSNRRNMGVGFSSIKGFKFLINEGCEIVIKLDSDGQMYPELIPQLIKPIIDNKSEAAKGNRFTSLDHIKSMPKIRIIGNLGLSFINKVSTGYWELFDPTNGFIAFKSSALQRVRLDKVDNRYFFESDLLFQCGLANIRFLQMPMKSQYSDEVSNLIPIKQLLIFSKKHFLNTFKRIIYQYFLLDFNVGSIEIIGATISGTVLILIGSKIFLGGIFKEEYATPGEANIFSISVIILIQFILGFIYFDSTQTPLLRRIRKY